MHAHREGDSRERPLMHVHRESDSRERRQMHTERRVVSVVGARVQVYTRRWACVWKDVCQFRCLHGTCGRASATWSAEMAFNVNVNLMNLIFYEDTTR
jgi:hypothetical protein